ncbi:hypothetical protein IDJ77_15120 [Mucilaginibacter sp. ZT4R22]|uniref:Uncharacterized protein n=1 Tax=Mucilaginibacter pankratovii TaxID=2772110 RepID=A0ABR7WS63_9SPHI|nr:hypothetical protein [Mucilaginibacter pankratovii]MBD1365146.1 hypothetical protein [Mucilaginibacter pankratovii]
MIPKPFKQSLKYNSLLMPKEHREVVDRANMDLWNDLMAINTNNPKEEIKIDHVIKDLGHSYAVDMKISCKNSAVQQQLDAVYERNMRLPRFTKHEHFDAMIS